MVFAVYSDAESTAKTLQTAIDTFLANPNDETLKAARAAWVAARVPYLQSEVFRFGNTIIDDWEGQVNAWPLDEGLIDYTDKSYEHALGNPGATANIIANTEIQVGEDKVDVKDITPEKLASLNELGGSEANVATGYHAIEFLLWGQDLNGTGPGAGNRPCVGLHDRRRCNRWPQRAPPHVPARRDAIAGQRPGRNGRQLETQRRRQLPRHPGGRTGHRRPAQNAVRHGQPVARRTGR
jgi:uncharacterized iron-regulated protein